MVYGSFVTHSERTHICALDLVCSVTRRDSRHRLTSGCMHVAVYLEIDKHQAWLVNSGPGSAISAPFV